MTAADTGAGVRPLDAEGRLARALQIPSPNCDARPAGSPINLLVLHSISLPPGEFGGPAVIDFFLNRLDHGAHPYYEQIRGMEVSAHFFIRRSGELIQSLMRRNLIGEFVLLIHPLVLGSGRRLFADGGAFATLRLAKTVTTTTGVVIATYQMAEPTTKEG